MEDLYSILEVSQDASLSEIKKSFQKLALIHHPDKQVSTSPDPSAFQKLSMAWGILSVEEERKRYDADYYNRNVALKSTGPFHEHVPFEEFIEGNTEYSHPCRCGDFYTLTERDILLKLDIVYCRSCSLYVIVDY